MYKTKEEIEAEVEKCKDKYDQLKGNIDHLKDIDFVIEPCDIDAMREVAWNGELKFWEHCNKMTCAVQVSDPDIRLYSAEIEVEEHIVEKHAYKNV